MNHTWPAEVHRAMGEIGGSAPPAPDLDRWNYVARRNLPDHRRRAVVFAGALTAAAAAVVASVQMTDSGHIASSDQTPVATTLSGEATSEPRPATSPLVAGPDGGGQLPAVAGVLTKPMPFADIPDIPSPGVEVSNASPEYRAADTDGDGFLSNSELVPGALGTARMNLADGTTAEVDIAMYTKFRVAVPVGGNVGTDPTSTTGS